MNSSQANKRLLASELVQVTSIIAISIIGLMLASSTIPLETLTQKYEYKSLIVMLFIFVQNFLIFLPIYFLAIKRRKLTATDFGFRKTKVFKSIFYILLSFFAFFASMFLLNFIQIHFGIPIPGLGEQANRITIFGNGTINQIIGAFSIILVAPLVEEIIFRGYFYQTLRQIFHPKLAILIGGILFGVIHLEFNVLIPLSVLGIIICSLYEKTNSIWPAIAFHAINNSITFIILSLST